MTNYRLTFLHPDLGIGGAERLVIDAALAVQNEARIKLPNGIAVDMFTAHHDRRHCFKETIDGSLKVSVAGDWLPRSIFGYCYALCAYLRFIVATISFCYQSANQRRLRHHKTEQIVFCDQISACIPFLRLLMPRATRIIFYCHFPDLLLSTNRVSLLKRLYRLPLDWIEEHTTGMSDTLLVNSQFTKGILLSTFPSLRRTNVQVLYPSVTTFNLDKYSQQETQSPHNPKILPDLETLEFDAVVAEEKCAAITDPYFLSINRYERKKDVGLAIEAFAKFIRAIHESAETTDEPLAWKLVIAGGFDERVRENKEYYEELLGLAHNLGLLGGRSEVDEEMNEGREEQGAGGGHGDEALAGEDFVIFLKSPSDKLKVCLLMQATALIYTPENEHFGIVPLEAMYLKTPVIASDSGGPLETVVDAVTGYHCRHTSQDFASAMQRLASEGGHEVRSRMGEEGRQRVMEHFSAQHFAQALMDVLFPWLQH